ncbi:MAG: cache domain-containing protein, partial [Thermodesulfobacteriota bacterium]|nr:cache domain-containing protein [Thermodesulfobacteriota bacterium]
MKTRKSIIKTFMIIMIVMAYFPVVILGGVAIQRQYSAFDKESQQLREKYISAQEIIVKHEVEKAIKDIQYRRQNTRLSEKELKKKILKWLSTIRFPNRGNDPGIFFVRSYKGIRLMGVSAPELIGKDTSKMTDPNGINTHEQFMRTIKNPEGGYVEYSWYNPFVKKVAPKKTFIKGIPDWKWYIGTGFWFDDINSVIDQKRL